MKSVLRMTAAGWIQALGKCGRGIYYKDLRAIKKAVYWFLACKKPLILCQRLLASHQSDFAVPYFVWESSTAGDVSLPSKSFSRLA